VSKAVLLDVDRTLFDTDRFRREALVPRTVDAFGVELSEKIWEIYDQRRHEFGGLVDSFIRITSESFGLDIGKLTEIFYKHDFEKFLYEGAGDFIKELRILGYEIIFYSNGSVEGDGPFEEISGFQAEKIRGLGLIPDHVICSKNKVEALEENRDLLKKYEKLLHIDDSLEVIDATREKLTELKLKSESIRIIHQEGGFGLVLDEIRQTVRVEGGLTGLSSK